MRTGASVCPSNAQSTLQSVQRMGTLDLYAKVRATLKSPQLAVRTHGDTVEVFGFPPGPEVSGRTYPFWYFAGKVSDFQ